MATQQETMILLAAAEARGVVDRTQPVEDQMRAAMEVTKDFWMSVDEEVRFRGAVAAVLLENEGNDEVWDRINTEMRMLNTLGAMMGGIPVDVERALPPEDFKRIGIRDLWMEIGHPQYQRSTRRDSDILSSTGEVAMTGPEAEAEQPESNVAPESPPTEPPASDGPADPALHDAPMAPSIPDVVAPIRDADSGDERTAPPVDAPTPAAEAPAPVPLPGPFVVSGLEFQRNEEGGVVIRRRSSPDPNVTPTLLAVLDHDSWCSIVAAVSASGDTAESFQWAGSVHDARISE